MDVLQIVLVAVLVLAGALCGVAVWALRDLVVTSRSLRLTSEQVRSRLVPLLDKADVTVDAVNVELLRLDGIITQFEDTSSRVSHASATITDIVNAPAGLVSEAALRMRQAWKDRKRTQSAGGSSEPHHNRDEEGDQIS
ncbi:MAG: hypothetical protein CVT67_06105 [Actinobacteria bacterium HGW-Actinobacteria-7]|nr:MAG: hypothetical protein CVT67_06105 [Actinobacteria bacterium HGW-Actinobacteria-7]